MSIERFKSVKKIKITWRVWTGRLRIIVRDSEYSDLGRE